MLPKSRDNLHYTLNFNLGKGRESITTARNNTMKLVGCEMLSVKLTENIALRSLRILYYICIMWGLSRFSHVRVRTIN